MRAGPSSTSDHATAGQRRLPRVPGAEGLTTLGAARLRAWTPILMRVLAGSLALLGLAGIGLAASRSPESLALAAPQATLEMARMASGVTSATYAHRPAAPTLAAEPAVTAAPALTPPPASASGTPGAVPLASLAGAAAPRPCPEVAAASPPPAAERRGLSVGAIATGERVALNLANATELQRLPGVGAKRAEAIVQLRARLGRFRRESDLLRIKGIGPRTLERMLPHLTLDPAP
jgi:competence protein ComEA